MKKILILLMFIMVLGLGACVPSSTLNDYRNDIDDLNTTIQELQEQVDDMDTMTAIELEALEMSITLLEIRLDNMTITIGLGGQGSYYEPSESDIQTMSVMILEVEQLKDTFDKQKAPAYLLDDLGEYVSFEQLAYKLKAKYFGDETVNEVDLFTMGSQAYFRFGFISDMSEEEVIARIVLMIEELRLYSFYLLSSPELVIHIYRFAEHDYQTMVAIPLTVVINDYFQITCDGLYDGDYDIRTEFNTELDLILIEAYYDAFVLNETFSGFVLNYK